MTDSTKQPGSVSPEIVAHYESMQEAERLLGGTGQLELARTQAIIQRYLPPPPAVILDVGGGAGIYACWLAKMGYEVHLVDAVPLHVKQAREASQKQPGHPLTSIEVGDARNLDWADASADVVLLLGPLYHLTERSDRVLALREAQRVLRNGGVVFAAGISRFASTLYGLLRGFMDDPEFVQIARQDLIDGQHRNPHDRPHYFTTAYFHHPNDLKAEVEEAQLKCEKVLAIEGVAGILQNFEEHWQNPKRQERLLEITQSLEEEPSLLGVSSHIMAVARGR
jgi:ubiquinone/menaquinone biosynthesis C-methylase UbiE